MHNYHLTLKSGNAKTGPIPVSVTSADTCPTSCGQYANCYAKSGPLSMHWSAVNSGKRGMTIDEFCAAIESMPEGQLWRHNQAGDLPGEGESIDRRAMVSIILANRGRRGFTYTHKPMTESNQQAVICANKLGFAVNLSADTIAQADEYAALGIAPVVVTVPENTRANFTTPGGNKVVICPAETKGVTCAQCKLCAWSERKVIIAFPAHGSKKSAVTAEKVFQVIG
jgi:hypothetical protein